MTSSMFGGKDMDRLDSGESVLKKLKNDSIIKNNINTQSTINGKYSTLKKITVGSRKSQLALFQTNFVVDQLRKKHSNAVYEIKTMTTTGDQILNLPLSKIGEKSLFTKELEVSLEKKEVHFVVHSLKDLPTSLPTGMVIGGICKRETPFDAIVFSSECECKELGQLPKGSIIGTSSLRRIAQLKRSYPDLTFKSVRGNLNTRLRKLDEDKVYSALILAAAGLIRLDIPHRISKIIDPDECMYAVGQGAIGIECRDDDLSTIEFLSKISDRETTLCCVAERAFMKTLEGGCSVPVAVHSTFDDDKITLKGGVFNLDGSKSITEKQTVDLKSKDDIHVDVKDKHFCGVVAPHLNQHNLKAAESLGTNLAVNLLEKGAKEILQEARTQNGCVM